MAVREDFMNYLNQLENQMRNTTDDDLQSELIGKFLYLKYEYESADNWEDTAENQKLLDNFKNGIFDKDQQKRIKILSEIADKYKRETFSVAVISPRLYEKVVSYKIDSMDDFQVDYDACRAEREELAKEDEQYLADHPDEDVREPHPIFSDARNKAIMQKYGLVYDRDYNSTIPALENINYNGKNLTEIVRGFGMREASSRTGNIFRVWLMGAKGYSYEQAVAIDPESNEIKELVNEYVKFLDDNRVLGEPPVSEAEKAERIGNMAKFFVAAGKKLEEFKLPDIDYSDINAVREHNKLLMSIGGMTQDFSQELEALINTTPCGLKYAFDGVGGEKNYFEATSNWELLGTIGTTISDGYFSKDFNNINNPVQLQSAVKKASVNIAANISESKNYRGKTIKQISEERNKDPMLKCASLHLSRMFIFINYQLINIDDAYQFMQDHNQKFQSNYELGIALQQYEMSRTQFNDGMIVGETSYLNAIKQANEDNALTNVLNEIFTENATGQEIYERLNNSPNKQMVIDAVARSYNKFISNSIGRAQMAQMMGITPIDMISVDNTSPTQLYGDKYSFIENQGIKETMIQAEIIHEILAGKKNVSIKKYEIDENNKVIQKEGVLSLTPEAMDRGRAYLMEVNELHNEFIAIKDLFAKYQKDKNANFSGTKEEGSEYYRNMIGALKKCIEASDIDKTHTNIDLKDAMEEYRKAARIYYKERKGLITGPLTSKGQIRLRLADDALNHMMERYDKLSILEKDVPVMGDKNSGIKMSDLKEIIRTSAGARNVEMKNNDFVYGNNPGSQAENYVNHAAQLANERCQDYKTNRYYNHFNNTDPDKIMSSWSAFQNKAVDTVKNSDKHLKEIFQNNENDYMNYVLGKDQNGNYRNNAEDMNIEEVGQAYDRMAEVVAHQLIVSPNFKSISKNVAFSNNFFNELKADINNYLVEKDALDSNMIGAIKNQLNNDALKLRYMEHKNELQRTQQEINKNLNNNRNKNIENKNIKNGMGLN